MLNRRGLILIGSAAASLTLIGNKQVMALVSETDRYHRIAAGAQNLITMLPPEHHAMCAMYDAAPPISQVLTEEQEIREILKSGDTERMDRVFSGHARFEYFRSEAFRRVSDANSAWVVSTPGSPYRQWLAQADTFVGVLMDLFPENPDPQMVSDIFDDRLTFDVMDDTSLRRVVPGIVPIAVTRALVTKHHAPFHMSMMENFQRYADRYRPYIMTGDGTESDA